MTSDQIEIVRTVVIRNKYGLHARPAAEFVKLAARFRSQIFASKEDTEVNGKSIMGVMMLAAGKGSIVVLDADGKDEQQAIDALSALINGKFGEPE